MLEIIRLSAKNYVHYKNLEIDFKKLKDNLVFITGRNLDTAGSVSNGAGKSVIGDLITDLLFDKTVRKHSSNSFIGSFAKWNVGTIQIRNDLTEDLYTIRKYRNHPKKKDKVFFTKKDKNGIKSSLTRKKKIDTYAAISNEFSINWRTFKNRNYFGQRDFERFLAVTDYRKAEIIIDIMDLNDFQKCKIISRKVFTELLNKSKIIELELLNMNNQLENYTNQEKALKNEIINSISKSKEEMNGIKEKFDDIKKKVRFAKSYSKNISDIRLVLKSLKADLENFDPVLKKEKKLQGEMSKLKLKIGIEVSNMKKLGEKISREENNIRDIKNQKIKRCPACGASLNASRIKKSIKESTLKIEKSEKDKLIIEKGVNKFLLEEANLSDALKELEEVKAKFFPLMKKREVVLKKLRKAEKWEAMLFSYNKQLIDLKSYFNTLKSKIKEPVGKESLKKLIKEIRKTEKDIKSKKEEFDKIIEERDKNEFSEKVYEGTIRSLFNSFIDNLNTFSNEYLGTLSDNDISVIFSPKTKRKSKKVVDKINVVVNVDGNAPRNFRTYSGGEIGKIEISTLLALFSSADSPFPFLFLDEPFHGVDLEGRDRIVELLREKADEGNKVLVISHEDVVASYGLNLKVIRENGESRINS